MYVFQPSRSGRRSRSGGYLRRPALKLLVTAMFAASIALVPTAAPADTRAFDDRQGDVRHGMDIHKVRIHNEQRLVITTRHRRVQPGQIAFYIDTRPAAGPEYAFFAGVGFGTDWAIVRMRNWRVVSDGPRHCPSDYSFSRRTDTVRASISRACLDGADRVRVSVKANDQDRGPDWAPGYRRFFPWIAHG